jgi:hypothetical protein
LEVDGLDPELVDDEGEEVDAEESNHQAQHQAPHQEPHLHAKVSVTREMENISRGSTFVDFVIICTERSMQDVTVARLQSTRVEILLSFLF